MPISSTRSYLGSKRSYTELLEFCTLEDRFRYLSLDGEVGCATFGSRRYLNQAFYSSREWRDIRNHIIFRDQGCDLGIEDFPILRSPAIHHINPITVEDVMNRSPRLLDPENLITASHHTHNAIHYGDERQLPRPFVERRPGDTDL